MWSQILLCALVGFAAASDYGWQDNKEYIYHVRGRTLTGLHDVENQYAGILIKAKLIVHPQSDGYLMAKIVDGKYSQVHAHLPDGWKSEISESELHYQPLELSQQPFKIVMKNGVVRDIIVSSDVHNWQANIIKSFVSQIQLDTQGEHIIKAHINQLPEEDSNNAVFKTMEDTVTGTYETLYDIAPLPEYILQSQPWLAPMPEIKGDGEFIEIVKSKNFSRGEERLGYYYGLGGMGHFEPNTNQMGDFFLRSSMSRAIVSGSLKHYTIQSSTTTNKIIVSPTLNSEQKGMVVSHLNLTLSEIKSASGSIGQPQQPKKLGSLTYTFNTPFSGEHEAREGSHRQEQKHMYSSEEERVHYRHRRSNKQDSTESESVSSSEEWAQEEAKLSQPPHSPLLPMYIGYKGKSIKSAQQVDVVQIAQKLAQQIGNDLQKPEHIPKEQTLSRYVILSTVARIMSQKEMEQAAQQLYTKEYKGAQADAWYAYRDAIAEAGTGPALLTVQEWIKNKKIQREEAAECISSMAESVRQPTEEYMRTFYNLVTKEQQLTSQAILNDTALLSYATLARKVYVDKHVSHNQFPVHSFGKFRTSKGQEFVVQELIPHLKEKLNHAVQQGDSHKVLVYIRALGNVGHQRILAVFEPYLEGDKQVSLFQRLQMVISLDKLVKVHPKVARSVLYKIYQNSGEAQELRVAAVYQLMRTCPPASMLQRMAQYTNVDTDEQVNAAVKYSIESAAELEGEEFSELSDNARSAQPLLTTQSYGSQYSGNYLRSYVQNEMNLFYKQTVHVYGSQDSFVPKGIKYALRAGLGGARLQIFNMQAMVSSIDELTNVFQRQSENFQQEQQQQQQNYQQAKQQQWSSESISELLNFKSDEREQLEGNLLIQIAGGATRFFTFNNRTVELLPKVIRELEDMLREGEDFHYTKFLNRYEMAISFPTEMAFPFIYTLDAPTLLQLQGQVRATAEPKISNGEHIRKPQSITAHGEIRALVSTKVEAKLGFVTPFDHHKYVSGYDKNMQFYLPIKSQVEVDLKKHEVHAQLQALYPGKDVQVFHYSTWPYTAKKDILRMEPLANGQDTKIVYSEDGPQSEYYGTVGKKSGVAFKVEYSSEEKFMDAYWLYEQYNRHDGVSALIAPFYGESIQHTKINLRYDAQASTARKVQIRMAHKYKYENGQGQGSNAEISQFSQLSHEQQARQEQFAKMANAGINSAKVRVCDIAVELDGDNKVEYTATAAVARSPVDDKARVLFYYRKSSANKQENRPYEVAVSAKAHIPNTNGLDFVYALKFDPTSTAEVDVAFGEDYQSATKLNLHAKLHQSESRKQYLKNHPRAQECREEMQEGNYQLPACANMTIEANLLDRVHVQVKYDNFGQYAQNITNKLYNAVRYIAYFNLDENTVNPHGSGKQNQFELKAHFEPDFESLNVTLWGEKIESHISNIRIGPLAKEIFAVHPVFRASTRAIGHIFDYDTYRPICVVDDNAANTFDNKTYPLSLEHDWTVMMQYAPEYAREDGRYQKYQEQQEALQLEQYVVLVRENGSKGKDVKVTLRTPESRGQLIEIDLKPVEGSCSEDSPCAKVSVNQKELQYNSKQTMDIEGDLIKIYALPNGEAKIQVGDVFYIIYDGKRVKIVAMHDKLRGAIRGLCGTFTGEEYDDFLAPKNCILGNSEDLVSAYTVTQRGNSKQRKSDSECYYEEINYANVISDMDAGRSRQEYSRDSHHSNQHDRKSGSGHCTKHQTRYQVQQNGDEICFTIRPLPTCQHSCSATNMVEKSVPVHCVQRSNVSDLWKKQIEKGASPDFSSKSPNKNIKMEVPESCVRY